MKASSSQQQTLLEKSSLEVVVPIQPGENPFNPRARPCQTAEEVCQLAEFYRFDGCRRINQSDRGKLGQFLTPLPIASRLAELFHEHNHEHVVLLDAGAGAGGLTAAAVQRLLSLKTKPKSLLLVAWEIEPVFVPLLEDILQRLCVVAENLGVKADYQIHQEDFIKNCVEDLSGNMFRASGIKCTHAILNPPFRKIRTDSLDRSALSSIGIECTNLYAAFVWVAGLLLCKGGEMAAITPRSFCNGPYFRPFRDWLLAEMPLDQCVMVEERDLAFSDDDVLQETVLYHGIRGASHPEKVRIETAYGADLQESIIRDVSFSQFVVENDSERFFHLVPDEHQAAIKEQMESLPCSLEDLGISVSTGRVVDFRATEHLHANPVSGSVPLIYPQHLASGVIEWPIRGGKKCNSIAENPETKSLLVEMGYYVLLRRFTSKEETRRVVATVFEPIQTFGGAQFVGFENHLNYYHANGGPLDVVFARGLSAFLNSSAVDEYFRQFNGHTQVNATDLRRMRYPSKEQLISLGFRCANIKVQAALDKEVAQNLNFMPKSKTALESSRRIEEALAILKALNAPREQQNERSALVLLTLAGIGADTRWADARVLRMGITEIMDAIREKYGKTYAPNTRETIRRFTVHQFVQIGLLCQNPDKPHRAVNSPHNVYELESAAFALLRTYGSAGWESALKDYKSGATKLMALREGERQMTLIPIKMPTGEIIEISAGGQNELMKAVVEQFCPRFTPGGEVLYLGDAGEKFIVRRLDELESLGVKVDEHGKMPDLVVFYTAKNWLVLIEAVTSHGPMNLKRKNELRALFGKSKAGLVFVTAFSTRSEMTRFLPEISWETEVWVAEAPTHMIHFNGERFLGPYEV